MNNTNKQLCEVCFHTMSIIDKHHIHSLSKGGTNCESNKCKLCPNCHRLIHSDEIILEGRFQTTEGNIIIWRHKGQPSITGVVDPPVFLYSELKKDDQQ